MNPTATITRLRALIDHPRTGAEERDAARRMLDRLLAKTSGAGDGPARLGGVGRHARIDGIVDAIRTDIAVTRMARHTPGGSGVVVRDLLRDAPEGVTFDVVADGESGIVVTIDAGVETASPELQALADRVAEVMNGYNHRGPDGTPRFFGRVRAAGRTLVW